MRELVRLANKKMNTSDARVEAIRRAREAFVTAEADEATVRRLKLFAYATRERWSRAQSNPKKNPYNWRATIEYWQSEGHWDQVTHYTKVTETLSSHFPRF